MWLSKEVLGWTPCESSWILTDLDWRRAYEIWRHADDLLSSQCNDFQLVDSITTLKRAVNHRLRQLETIYQFKLLFNGSHIKGLLNQISYFNVVRHLMAKKLIDIRNQVEHEDSRPPELERCKELLDFVWYFLKTTDKYIAMPTMSFSLTSCENENHFVELTREKVGDIDTFTVYGYVPPSHLCAEKSPGAIEINVDSTMTRGELFNASGDTVTVIGIETTGCEKDPSDLFFSGSLAYDLETLRDVYKVYFSLV